MISVQGLLTGDPHFYIREMGLSLGNCLSQSSQEFRRSGKIGSLGGGDKKEEITFIFRPEIALLGIISPGFFRKQGFPGRDKSTIAVEGHFHFRKNANKKIEIHRLFRSTRAILIQIPGKKFSYHLGSHLVIDLLEKVG